MTAPNLLAFAIVLAVAGLSLGMGAALSFWHCKDRALVALYLQEGMRHLDDMADDMDDPYSLSVVPALYGPVPDGTHGVVIYGEDGKCVVEWKGWPMTAGGRA